MIQSVLDRVFASLFDVFFGWTAGLESLRQETCERRRHRERVRQEGNQYLKCQIIPRDVYKRPDPLIYSQYYLLSQGLAVTWDNPDIQLYAVGPGEILTPVASNDLRPDTVYEIQATIYNGSTEAPAIRLLVEFLYLSFGIGPPSTHIGFDRVDLHVRGSALHPSLARMRWTTPPTPGHYCIQVKLIWEDDANPHNNLGQENVDVKSASSPAVFEFDTFNVLPRDRSIQLKADGYSIPPQLDCDKVPNEPARNGQQGRHVGSQEDQARDERQQWCNALARRSSPELHPVPASWTVQINPMSFTLAPGATQTVKVTIVPPEGWVGPQPINISGWDSEDGTPLGGVTLYIHSGAD
jgi:hypothetical protein